MSYILGKPPAFTGAAQCLSPESFFNTDEDGANGWYYAVVALTVGYNAMHLCALLQQYFAVSNVEKCMEDYRAMPELLQELYPEDKVLKSL